MAEPMLPEATRLFRSSDTPLGSDRAWGRTRLALGSLATQNGTFSGNSSGTNTGDQDLSPYLTTSIAAATYLTNAAAAATYLTGAAAASTYLPASTAAATYQPKDAGLTALAGAATVGSLYYLAAADNWQPVTVGTGLSLTSGTLAATGGGGSSYTPEFITAPLTSANDTRGGIGAYCYEPNLSSLSLKISISPHVWVSWSIFNK